MHEEATVTSKGQVTIPKEVRETLGIREGEVVVFLRQGNNIVIKPKIKNGIKELRKIREKLPQISREEIDRMIRDSKKEWSKFG